MSYLPPPPSPRPEADRFDVHPAAVGILGMIGLWVGGYWIPRGIVPQKVSAPINPADFWPVAFDLGDALELMGLDYSNIYWQASPGQGRLVVTGLKRI